MSTEEPREDAPSAADVDTPMSAATATPLPGKKRPRLDLTVLGGGERKRGKSMFGVLVNTLNKAKAEDKERNASDAAKKRQLIEKRLQNKLKKDADSVRQAEEAKKDKLTASRKEEDLQLKDSIYKLRRTRFPVLSNFLLTSDTIPPVDSDPDSMDTLQLSSLVPPRSHPPPLYYLPSILTPAQEAFLSKRKERVKEAAEKDWENFKAERTAGTEEVMSLRQKVAAVKSVQTKMENGNEQENGTNVPIAAEDEGIAAADENGRGGDETRYSEPKDSEMEVDDGGKGGQELEKKDERPVAADEDEDDAVEY